MHSWTAESYDRSQWISNQAVRKVRTHGAILRLCLGGPRACLCLQLRDKASGRETSMEPGSCHCDGGPA